MNADAFLAAFFGLGNDLSVDDLRSSHPDLADWLERRTDAVRETPTAAHVLPRRTGGTTKWYGLAHSDRQLRELAERLGAFVGPTYARFERGTVAGPDPIDGAVVEFTNGHALTFDVLPSKQEDVRQAIELLAEVTAREPRRTIAMTRPIGRLLREFDMAVLAGTEATSAELFDEIERSGRVSTDNLLFLRVRRLGGLHRSRDILALPQLATLLQMRRPAQVTATLFDAIYATYFARFESSYDATGAINEFVTTVLPKYPALFRSRQGLQTSTAVKTFFLYGIVAHPANTIARDELLGSPDLTDDERRFLTLCDQQADRPPAEPATLAAAETAARRGNFDIAFFIARDAPPTVERTEVLLRCAAEMRTIDAVTTAVAAFDGLTGAEIEMMKASRWLSALWDDVRSVLATENETSDRAIPGGPGLDEDYPATVTVPDSWEDWFARVAADPHFDQAAAIAKHGSVEWAVADLTSEASDAIHATLNADLDPEALRTIRDCLPSFLSTLERSPDVRRHQEVLEDIATLLLMTEGLGIADVQVLVDVIGNLLEIGLSKAQYRRLISDVLDLWKDVDSPAQLDNGIELLDVLLTYAATDPGAREEFFHALASSIARWRDRVKPGQWDVVTDLARDMGAVATMSSLRPDSSTELDNAQALDRTGLRGKTVAIYTLTDQAALRAKQFLHRHFDDVKVELANDHVASDRLRQLAHTADVFVLATRSAKHAATTYIQSERPEHLPVSFAGGKGSTSLIRAALGQA